MDMKSLKFGLVIMLFCCVSAFPLNVVWQGQPSVVPPTPSVGQTVVITASIRVADGPVQNLRVTGGVDRSIIYNNSWANIENNRARTFSFQWVAVAGSHTIFLQIDPERALAGQEASNDRIEIPLNVGGSGAPPQPELIAYNNEYQNTATAEIMWPDPCRQFTGGVTIIKTSFSGLLRRATTGKCEAFL